MPGMLQCLIIVTLSQVKHYLAQDPIGSVALGTGRALVELERINHTLISPNRRAANS
ncbi:MAG: hypothetical protein M1552_08635 [Firmicutes bacterium]|nr:hypothetical protein [Bacillota bacterium]